MITNARRERVLRASALRGSGKTHREVAAALGVTLGTAKRYLRDARAIEAGP